MVESELAKRVAKIKNTEDMVETGQKYGFLILVLGQSKYGNVTGKPNFQWTIPKDLGRYDDAIQVKDSAFVRSKGEKNIQGG